MSYIGHRGQSYETFYGHNLWIFVIILRVCPCEAFPAKSNVCGKGQEPTLEWSFITLGLVVIRHFDDHAAAFSQRRDVQTPSVVDNVRRVLWDFVVSTTFRRALSSQASSSSSGRPSSLAVGAASRLSSSPETVATVVEEISNRWPMLWNFLRPWATTLHNKLERLSLASLSSLV